MSSSSSSFILLQTTGTPMTDQQAADFGAKYKRASWFVPTVTISWTDVWTDWFWWTSLLLLVGYAGLGIASVISLCQVETQIAKGWIYWIFWVIQVALLSLHTIVYIVYRLQGAWRPYASNYIGRINFSVWAQWAVIAFVISTLSTFVFRTAFPVCCTNDVPGLTVGPIDVALYTQWYGFMDFYSGLCVAGMAMCYVILAALAMPEKRISNIDLQVVQLPQSAQTRTARKINELKVKAIREEM